MSGMPEKFACQQIDAQLVACCWVVHNSVAMQFGADQGIVLREMPLQTGPCDCFFPCTAAVGIAEAKKRRATLSGGVEQAASVDRIVIGTNGIRDRCGIDR